MVMRYAQDSVVNRSELASMLDAIFPRRFFLLNDSPILRPGAKLGMNGSARELVLSVEW